MIQKLLCGAGIVSNEDLQKARKLGAKDVIVSGKEK